MRMMPGGNKWAEGSTQWWVHTVTAYPKKSRAVIPQAWGPQNGQDHSSTSCRTMETKMTAVENILEGNIPWVVRIATVYPKEYCAGTHQVWGPKDGQDDTFQCVLETSSGFRFPVMPLALKVRC